VSGNYGRYRQAGQHPNGFINYQLIRFCQATRLHYLNGHVQLANQNVLQQHVDHKIANALLNQGTRDAYKTWNQQDRAWVDMRLHESYDEGRFGVPHNVITRHAASYTSNARFVAFLGTFVCPAQQVWLPDNDLQDPATWDATPLRRLKRMHEDLVQHYDCTDQPAAAQQAPPSAQAAALLPRGRKPAASARRLQGQRQWQTRPPATQPPPRGNQAESGFPPASSSSQDQQPYRPRPIPSQSRLTQQLTKEWPQYKALRQRYAGTRFEEQRQLHLPQKHKATVPEPALRVEMNVLEEQADNSQARDLYWTPLSWLGTIRLSSANDAFDPTLWATFVSTTLGLEVPVLSSPPQP
jgi:hypothetical protein